MKVFLDTNVILEYYCARKQYAFVEQIFESADCGQHEYHISLGSFYTITYILEDEFRQRGIRRPELTTELREALEAILEVFRVSAINEKQLLAGVHDLHFSDLEDSYQYQVAKSQGCGAIVTINTKDFRLANDKILKVLTPMEFVGQYVS